MAQLVGATGPRGAVVDWFTGRCSSCSRLRCAPTGPEDQEVGIAAWAGPTRCSGTKLAQGAKGEALLQLLLYSDLLAEGQGLEPERMHLALGGGGSENPTSFRVAEYAGYYRHRPPAVRQRGRLVEASLGAAVVSTAAGSSERACPFGEGVLLNPFAGAGSTIAAAIAAR